MAGSTKHPLVAFPITGSQVYVASGFAAFTRATASTTTSQMPGPPRYPERTASHVGSTRRSSIPVTTARTSSGDSSGPRHAPYPVWLEKTTVGTAHTSWPSRCNGKVAAELPTWPYATNDWIDRKRIAPSWHRRPRTLGCRPRGLACRA